MKKICSKKERLSPLSLLIALVMAMSMSMTAFAALDVTVDETIDLNIESETGAAVIGYDAENYAVEVTLTNEVDYEITDLTIALSGTDAASFELDPAAGVLEEIFAIEGTTSIIVKPVSGLTAKGSAGDGDGIYTATLEVTGTTMDQVDFTLVFTVTASNDATLQDLEYSVDGGAGVAVPNFDADTEEYDAVLPYGTAATAGVTLSGTPACDEAEVTTNDAVELINGEGTATIEVTAENDSTKTYTVNFIIAPNPSVAPLSHPPAPAPTTSSSSGSGGSSGGGGGSAPAAPAVPARSANVSADGSVNATAVTNDLKKELSTTAEGGAAVVPVKNADSISASALKSLAQAAAAAGKQAVIHADTVGADGKVQGRLYVDPAKLSGIGGSIKLGLETQGARPESRKMLFEKFYSNKVAVVSCAQEGSFGARLKLAAKVQLPGGGNALNFYSYDAKTNRFKKIQTSYRVDANGYVHFETALAGDIIISDKPLMRK